MSTNSGGQLAGHGRVRVDLGVTGRKGFKGCWERNEPIAILWATHGPVKA